MDITSQRIAVRAGIANFISSLFLALQSVIMLMAISRICTLEDAGVFTFGFANANLFLNMGRYGMRNYQASDADDKFSFRAYGFSRVITVVAMILTSTIYVCTAAYILGYSASKIYTMILLCIFKAEDAAEDVYQGNYQRRGRLDIAGVLLTVRLAASIAVFCVALFLLKSMNDALIVTVVFSAIFIVFEVRLVEAKWGLPYLSKGRNSGHNSFSDSKQAALELLKDCFPLFIAAFASFFITNAPKYAIDALEGDEIQAIFGYIFMPVFAVNLIANAVFQPQVSEMSNIWRKGDFESFKSLLLRQLLLTIAITLACSLGAYAIGIPILELMFHAELSAYRTMLVWLMVGGGLYALVVLLLIVLTIMRKQRGLGTAYVFLGSISMVLAFALVNCFGIAGASASYTLTMAIQVLLFLNRVYRELRCGSGR